MSLENYTGYIPSLVISNPLDVDPKSQGSGHLRGIKKTLALTLAGFTEEGVGVSVKASEINAAVAGYAPGRYLPPGMVGMFASSGAPPTGWLICDGAMVSKTTYPGLWAVLGDTWGASTGTQFKLPDLQNAFLRGGNLLNRPVGSVQAAEVLQHNHSGVTGPTAATGSTSAVGRHAHTVTVATATGSTTNGGGGATTFTMNPVITSEVPDHFHNFTSEPHTHTIPAYGGTENRPANIAIGYMIKT